jgi:hypothetical protein
LHTRALRLLLLLLAAERLGQYRRQEQRRGSTQRKAMAHKDLSEQVVPVPGSN